MQKVHPPAIPDDDIRPEYDLSTLRPAGPRGKYAARYAAGPVITPDGVLRPRQQPRDRVKAVRAWLASQVSRLTHRHSG